MSCKSSEFLVNAKTLRITVYLSLAIAHIIFGVLYPHLIVIAGSGFAFFACVTLWNLRPISTGKEVTGKKLFHFHK